jgi:hypothetical protein
MAAEGDLRISFRIVRVCTIEQTTLVEARNMRIGQERPSAVTVYRGVAERNRLRMALSELERSKSVTSPPRWGASDNLVERDRWV